MTYSPHGKHLIAGQWHSSSQIFQTRVLTGEAFSFYNADAKLVEQAVQAAEQAFNEYCHSSRQQRANFLRAIADEIEVRGDEITHIAAAETGLPDARLIGERGRTCGQLRLFADHILTGEYLDRRHDKALPDRQPLPRADLKMIQRPIGPVAVFGASNFPLAFSTAGGDTASALAAGCPVVVKGHPAHPGTAEIVAEAILAAIKQCDMPTGVFNLLQDSGESYVVGQSLVQHPMIKAVGFTGSLRAGRALFDLCVQRKEPIPFFGELGSINPMFFLPHAVADRGKSLAQGWAASLTMGAGQFCTNPGIAVMLEDTKSDEFVSSIAQELKTVSSQTMLTDAIAEGYRQGKSRLEALQLLQPIYCTDSLERQASPNLYQVNAETWLTNPDLAEEVFGPLGIVVMAKDLTDMLAVAQSLEGQLTCTLHMDEEDYPSAQRLMPILERKAGRVLANAFPTGVEVCDSMVHGGPYPASTNFGATSVGTMAIRRFLRPVCYQDIPDALLPAELTHLD